MFGKLIKKLKKRSVYWRIAIVYIIFLIIKWFMYETAGIEIGKEGFSASSLVARINGGATELAKLCSTQQVKNSSSNNETKLKLQLNKIFITYTVKDNVAIMSFMDMLVYQIMRLVY